MRILESGDRQGWGRSFTLSHPAAGDADMIGKLVIATMFMLTTMALFAVGANSCIYDGREYENRDALIIDGWCHVCDDGKWQRLSLNLSPERCKGKM